MKGKFLLLMLVLLANAGCNLSVNVIDNPPPLPSPTQPNAIVELPTNHPPTITSRPPTATIAQPTPAPTCTPRTDWPTYIVVAGDTLGRIAVRAGTSTATLIQANCLTNANLISVGQTLHVPRQPTPPTVIPPTAEPTRVVQQLGSIGVSPYLWADAGNYALPGGISETITWDGGPADAVRTDFFQRAPNGTMALISTDTNAADGLSTTWLAPINYTGELTASAIRSDGSTVTPAFRPSVSVLDPYSPNNALTLNTYLRFESDTYFVKPNQPEVITWTAFPPVAVRVDFTFSPADRSAQPHLLGSDTNLQDGASMSTTFAAGDLGIISAEAFMRDGTRLFFAKAITISAPTLEATAEATVEAN